MAGSGVFSLENGHRNNAKVTLFTDFPFQKYLNKKFLHLWRERNAGRLNKHTMRKLSSIYGCFFEYEMLLYLVESKLMEVVVIV